jgi:ABC-type dipeptide/oligopeptide/nickel transport system permease component
MKNFRAFLIRRVFFSIFTVWVITTLVFVLFRTAPGDPTNYIVDSGFPPEVREQILKKWGLDKPIWEQYGLYIWNLLQGDLGVSFFTNRPVIQELSDVILNTIILAFTSFLIAYPLGALIGSLLASKRDKWVDSLGISLTLFFRSAPLFWTGMIALMIFSFKLGWFPDRGLRDIGYVASSTLDKYLNLDFLHHLILPALVAGIYFAALPLMLTRNTMLEVLREDFIELARAKGLSERAILFRHGLRNSILPFVTAATVYIGLAVAGMVEIEVVFSWPGMGRAIVLALNRHDYPVAQGAFLVLAIMVSVMSLLADLVYSYLDPRITYN